MTINPNRPAPSYETAYDGRDLWERFACAALTGLASRLDIPFSEVGKMACGIADQAYTESLMAKKGRP